MAIKVILDTNLWSYIGDEGSGDELQRALDSIGCVVLLAPSMLLELLRNPHSESRAKHIATITKVKGRRLASEAQLCAEDFIKLVRRERPQWRRAIADMATVDKYHREWTRNVWLWAAEDHNKAHRTVTSGLDVSKEIVDAQRTNRRAFLQDNFSSDYSHLLVRADSLAAAERYIPGWDGSDVDGWRFDLASRYWFNMTTRKSDPNFVRYVQTHRDWIGSRIDLATATADASDFAKLWFQSATPRDVPRDWIRAALAYTQITMKIGRGNAADEQHSAYLPDADYFLTSDKPLVSALAEVHRQADFRFADAVLIDYMPGTQATAKTIVQELTTRLSGAGTKK